MAAQCTCLTGALTPIGEVPSRCRAHSAGRSPRHIGERRGPVRFRIVATHRVTGSGIAGAAVSGDDRRFFQSGWVNVVGWTAWVLMFVLPSRIDGPWGIAALVICSVTATACFLRVRTNQRRRSRHG